MLVSKDSFRLKPPLQAEEEEEAHHWEVAATGALRMAEPLNP